MPAAIAKGMTLARAHEPGGGFDSMREAYDEEGVDGYYSAHGAEYRNPHETILLDAIGLGLTTLEDAGIIDASSAPLRVLDFGCGSGEAHLAVNLWTSQCDQRMEATVTASDPYTYAAYESRMGARCERWSFEDVAAGCLDEAGAFDVCISAFCLHLIDKSYMQTTLTALARACNVLVLASPHKRPHITSQHGWEEATEQILTNRIHIRCFISLERPRPEPAAVAAAAERAAAAKAVAAAAAAAAASEASTEASTLGGVGSPEMDAEREDAAAAAIEAEEMEAAMAEIAAEVEAMNLASLRAALEARGLDASGKKQALAERLRAARVSSQVYGADEAEDDEEEETAEDGADEEGGSRRRRAGKKKPSRNGAGAPDIDASGPAACGAGAADKAYVAPLSRKEKEKRRKEEKKRREKEERREAGQQAELM